MAEPGPPRLFVGVDVGTASVRAGVFDAKGTQLSSHSQSIHVYTPEAGMFEQSSVEIWDAVVVCVADALSAATATPDDVAGIGFDATCSLVVLDASKAPVSVTPPGAQLLCLRHVCFRLRWL